ncbi:MAG: septum formation protein Maf [Bdellovibrionales bacterium]|nr:septum formation protein Maf [Bdellovibrionales bacterium]
MEKTKIKLILASASPRRKELLGHLQLPFDIVIKNIPEETHYTDPVNFCRHIAQMKGDAVFKERIDNCMVVSADTIVSMGAKIYGKPSGLDEARLYLNELAGKTHSVFTAVTINLKLDKTILSHSFVEESKVTFNQITPELMERYLATGDSLDKAGAYGIQGPSLTFISKVEGDYANVVGFPLSRFVLECEALLKPFTRGQSWFELF